MSQYYITKQNETLDKICWEQYIKNEVFNELAGGINLDPIGDSLKEQMKNFMLQRKPGTELWTIYDLVLFNNPILSNFDLMLPEGIEIYLPDIIDDSEEQYLD